MELKEILNGKPAPADRATERRGVADDLEQLAETADRVGRRAAAAGLGAAGALCRIVASSCRKRAVAILEGKDG